MATTLTSAVSVSVSWSYASTLAWGNATNSSAFSYSSSLANGTGQDQADRIYISSTTLAASGTLNLDLAGSLTDIFGSTITMARVKVIYFELTDDTTATSFLVGGHATAALANIMTSADTLANDQPKIRVRNNGCFLLCAPDSTGYAVTATTGDILLLTNADSSNTATYKLVIIGASV